MKNKHLFVYGTLMLEQVRFALLKKSLPVVSATLEGYRREIIRGEVYPGIIEDDQASVPGQLVQGLTTHHLQILDLFEGQAYLRKPVHVIVEEGGVNTETYVLQRSLKGCLAGKPWCPEHFQRTHLRGFLSQL